MMSIEQFIADSTKFFDEAVSKVGQGLSTHGRTSKFTSAGPSVTVDNKTYHWALTLNVTETATPNSSKNDIPATPRQTYVEPTHKAVEDNDVGWNSIDKLFSDPDFKEHFNEVDRDV